MPYPWSSPFNPAQDPRQQQPQQPARLPTAPFAKASEQLRFTPFGTEGQPFLNTSNPASPNVPLPEKPGVGWFGSVSSPAVQVGMANPQQQPQEQPPPFQVPMPVAGEPGPFIPQPLRSIGQEYQSLEKQRNALYTQQQSLQRQYAKTLSPESYAAMIGWWLNKQPQQPPPQQPPQEPPPQQPPPQQPPPQEPPPQQPPPQQPPQGGVYQPPSGTRRTVVPTPAKLEGVVPIQRMTVDGRDAYRFTLRDGDVLEWDRYNGSPAAERSEIVYAGPADNRKYLSPYNVSGTTGRRVYDLSLKFDQQFPTQHRWATLLQFHPGPGASGWGFSGVAIHGNYIDITNPMNPNQSVARIPIQTGQWYDLRLDVNWSAGGDGYVRIYNGGQLVGQYQGPTAKSASDWFYIQQGYYRSGEVSQTGIVYQTPVKIYEF